MKIIAPKQLQAVHDIGLTLDQLHIEDTLKNVYYVLEETKLSLIKEITIDPNGNYRLISYIGKIKNEIITKEQCIKLIKLKNFQ